MPFSCVFCLFVCLFLLSFRESRNVQISGENMHDYFFNVLTFKKKTKKENNTVT